jgi:hypothetical protein
MFKNIFFGPPTIKYCEENINNFIRQPSLVFTNAIFFISAFLLLKNFKDSKFVRKYSLILIIVGFFSTIYHWGITRLTQILDIVSVMLLIAFITYVVFKELSSRNALKISIIVFLPLSLSIVPKSWFSYVVGGGIFLLVLFIIQLYINKRDGLNNNSKVHIKELYLSVALILIGLFFHLLAAKNIWCNPTGHIISGHGLWHILGGLATYFLFLFIYDLEKTGRLK